MPHIFNALKSAVLTVGVAACLGGCASMAVKDMPKAEMLANPEPVYNYPIDNPYAATIIGTPAEMKQKYPDSIKPDEETLVVYPDRKIPEGFWYYDGLVYGEMLQNHAAPLVYIVGGTGSGYKSRSTVALANALYSAGNHVVMLPSPTHTNFTVTASSNFYPGNADTDAADLYRVITMIQPKIAKKEKITSTGITGYSLGAWHTAAVARLDEKEKKIGFDKILLINTPLSLYSSMHRLDEMLLRGLPNGVDGLSDFLDKTMARLSRVSNDSDALDFSNENLLLEGYLQNRPSDDRMATIIGTTFRLSAANMIFTSDVMSHAGYIFPKDRPYLSSTPLNDYLAVALRTGWSDYYKDIYTTYYLQKYPGMKAEGLVEQSSLEGMRGWIASNPRIMLLTNRDDIILGPGELAALESLFAGKIHVFPTGGHLGNMEHPAFVWQVTKFFNGDAK